MTILLQTIEFLGLSLWLGSDVFLSFVVAPGALSDFGERTRRGHGRVRLWWMHMIGVVCGYHAAGAIVRTRTFASTGDAGGVVCRTHDWAHSRVATFG